MSEFDHQAAGYGDALIDQVADWLITRALQGGDIEALFQGCFERLRAAIIPLWRGSIAFFTLPPLFGGMGLIWKPEDGLVVEGYRHNDMMLNETFRKSPIAAVLEGSTLFLRRSLTGPDAMVDFEALADFRDEGATDYLINATAFSDTSTVYGR